MLKTFGMCRARYLERVSELDRLFWEVYIKDPDGFINHMDQSVSFLHIYFGDVREAVAHTDKISKFGRVIYNKAAWDTDKFKDINEEITCANHYDVIKEVILRIEKYKCKKVDMGFLGRWKNPYQIADTFLPSGITVTYEIGEGGLILMKGTFFKPENWFNLQCKPLFKTDAIVEKEAHASWNMNQVGLIAAKHEKVAANRRAMFNMLTGYLKEYQPMFMSLATGKIYYNQKANCAYIEDPGANEDDALMPLLYAFHEPGGKILYSDSTPVDESGYATIMVGEFRIHYDRKHFEF